MQWIYFSLINEFNVSGIGQICISLQYLEKKVVTLAFSCFFIIIMLEITKKISTTQLKVKTK